MVIETGISKLDDILEGGLHENRSVLLLAQPGVHSMEFAWHLFYHQMKKYRHGVYLVNNKPPRTVRESFLDYGWDLNQFEKKRNLVFIDSFSALMNHPSSEKFVVEDIADIESINKELGKSAKSMGGNHLILMFDSLSPILDTLQNSNPDEYIKKWLGLENTTFIFLLTSWLYPPELIRKVKQLFDCVIELKAVERRVIVRNYFTVSKASWVKKVKQSEIPFKVIKPQGVNVYIPKILVTGPYNAGKTSFIHSASVKAVSADRLGTTVALDHGKVVYQGMLADLFGTPGQERFDPIMEMLGGDALGVIIVVDSTAPNGFARAKDMLEKTKTRGLPSVVVANKADLKGALNPGRIRRRMKLPKDIPIIPVRAKNLKSVKQGRPCRLNPGDVANVLTKLFEIVV